MSDRSKFVIAELFNNEDGKTSGSGFIGILVGLIGCIAFLVALVGYLLNIPNTIDVMQQSSIFIGTASALLAARKFRANYNNRRNDRYNDRYNDSYEYSHNDVYEETRGNSRIDSTYYDNDIQDPNI